MPLPHGWSHTAVSHSFDVGRTAAALTRCSLVLTTPCCNMGRPFCRAASVRTQGSWQHDHGAAHTRAQKNSLAPWPGGLFEMHVWLLGILGLAGCNLQGGSASLLNLCTRSHSHVSTKLGLRKRVASQCVWGCAFRQGWFCLRPKSTCKQALCNTAVAVYRLWLQMSASNSKLTQLCLGCEQHRGFSRQLAHLR